MDRVTLLAVGSLYALEGPRGAAAGGIAAEAALAARARGAVAVPIARVGMDRMGREATEALRNAGLDVSSIQVDPDLPTPRLASRGDVRRMEPYGAFDNLQFDADVEGLARGADVVLTDACSRRHGQGRSAIDRVLTTAANAVRVVDLVRRSPPGDRLDRECVGNAAELAQIFLVDATALRAVVPAVTDPVAAADRLAGQTRATAVILLDGERTLLRGQRKGEGAATPLADSHALAVDVAIAATTGGSLLETIEGRKPTPHP